MHWLGLAARSAASQRPCGGYYSYDLGTWHIVVLNTECSKPGVGGCTSSSPQGRWLAAPDGIRQFTVGTGARTATG